jgi:hypothetical protein
MRAVLVALTLCGPLGWPGDARAQQESPGITDRMKSFFGFGSSTPQPGAGAPASAGPPEEIECPDVSVRQGASTLAISTAGNEASPMSTRYQVTIGQTARECAALGGVMTMKVGVQGRVLLGPAGGPGRVDVPLRVAVVEEGTTPKPIVSKLYRITVDVPPGQTMVPFTHVDQDVTFPMPRGDAIDSYVVYVGFDPSATPAKPERKKKK